MKKLPLLLSLTLASVLGVSLVTLAQDQPKGPPDGQPKGPGGPGGSSGGKKKAAARAVIISGAPFK